MSLLRRIALSNGDKVRKMAANQMLVVMDETRILAWNNQLQAAIDRKQKLASDANHSRKENMATDSKSSTCL